MESILWRAGASLCISVSMEREPAALRAAPVLLRPGPNCWAADWQLDQPLAGRPPGAPLVSDGAEQAAECVESFAAARSGFGN